MEDTATTNANEVIAALRAGQSGIVENLYDRFRKEFLSWADKRFYTTPGDIEDAWQEAVIVFYEQTTSRKLTVLHCSVKTYLFAVGYKWLLKNHRKMKRLLWKDEMDEALAKNPQVSALDFDDAWEVERDMLHAAMLELSPRCRELLVWRHYREHSISEIMTAFQYATANTVSVSLSNCLSKLKEIIEEKTKK